MRGGGAAGIHVHAGVSGLEEVAALEDADIVLCAVVGIAGLQPVLSALSCGKNVALATKEVLVAAGGIVTKACAASGAALLPVDSEHSAVFQCLQGRAGPHPRMAADAVRRIVLTASGGAFGSRSDIDFSTVTVQEALEHPTWNMGRKVTVDSATLMNKGLEIIEAHWLFGMPVDRIGVVVHPESIVHSMVEFVDGSVVAQMSVPDMRFAIQYALTYPERIDGGLPELDLTQTAALSFREPDEDRFPCLRLARKAGERGGTLPAVLNAANEVAVERFLGGEIPFSGIWRMVEGTMERHDVVDEPALEQVLKADAWARCMTRGTAADKSGS